MQYECIYIVKVRYKKWTIVIDSNGDLIEYLTNL